MPNSIPARMPLRARPPAIPAWAAAPWALRTAPQVMAMYSQRGAARYQAVASHGLVANASPARLVQVMFEQILSRLATAQGCMERIENNLPLNEVVAKGKSLGKAIRLIDQLNSTLDMVRGREIAENLRALY